jgi:hypothetical protein
VTVTATVIVTSPKPVPPPQCHPPKRVAFVGAWVLELKERGGGVVCGVERFIAGECSGMMRVAAGITVGNYGC